MAKRVDCDYVFQSGYYVLSDEYNYESYECYHFHGYWLILPRLFFYNYAMGIK